MYVKMKLVRVSEFLSACFLSVESEYIKKKKEEEEKKVITTIHFDTNLTLIIILSNSFCEIDPRIEGMIKVNLIVVIYNLLLQNYLKQIEYRISHDYIDCYTLKIITFT